MEEKTTDNNPRKIVGVLAEKTFNHPKSKKSRWIAISRKIKIAAILLGALVASSAAFFENLEKITNFFKKEERPTIPFIVVKISNSGSKNEVVYGRGDFVLWLPGPSISHISGKYEFLSNQGDSLDKITVKSKETVTALAKIMNENSFAKIFSNGDCDLSLILYREKKHMLFTENVPFTENAIKKYYLTADTGKK